MSTGTIWRDTYYFKVPIRLKLSRARLEKNKFYLSRQRYTKMGIYYTDTLFFGSIVHIPNTLLTQLVDPFTNDRWELQWDQYIHIIKDNFILIADPENIHSLLDRPRLSFDPHIIVKWKDIHPVL